jgi:hypothetical protein
MAYQESLDFEAQQENLERVSTRIAAAIIRFLRGHEYFYADDLRKAVVNETGIAAPASADRVLRDLRQRGIIDYVVVSRHESYYRTLRVPKEG